MKSIEKSKSSKLAVIIVASKPGFSQLLIIIYTEKPKNKDSAALKPMHTFIRSRQSSMMRTFDLENISEGDTSVSLSSIEASKSGSPGPKIEIKPAIQGSRPSQVDKILNEMRKSKQKLSNNDLSQSNSDFKTYFETRFKSKRNVSNVMNLRNKKKKVLKRKDIKSDMKVAMNIPKFVPSRLHTSMDISRNRHNSSLNETNLAQNEQKSRNLHTSMDVR